MYISFIISKFEIKFNISNYLFIILIVAIGYHDLRQIKNYKTLVLQNLLVDVLRNYNTLSLTLEF